MSETIDHNTERLWTEGNSVHFRRNNKYPSLQSAYDPCWSKSDHNVICDYKPQKRSKPALLHLVGNSCSISYILLYHTCFPSSRKMAWWLFHLKSCTIFLVGLLQIAREIQKMCFSLFPNPISFCFDWFFINLPTASKTIEPVEHSAAKQIGQWHKLFVIAI